MRDLFIEKVIGREVLDSRGNPTVEAEVYLSDGTVGRGIAPSGASKGVYEALELRDTDKKRYHGKGVLRAVENINIKINDVLRGMKPSNIYAVDKAMIEADGTEDKTNLGANAILAVSVATAHAVSLSKKIPLYRYFGGVFAKTMPMPMMNIINGGAHSKNNLDFQEFMIMPVSAVNFREALRMGTEVYHELKKVLEAKKLSTAVGDEGGFAPDIDSVENVFEILMESVSNAGYQAGKDICFAIDVAASEWKSEKGTGYYYLPKSKKEYTTEMLIEMYKSLIEKYPIVSIEDGLDEEDWEGWKRLTEAIGNKTQLVGDDLFVTNTKRLSKGIELHCANAILIKPNQIGSITETIETIRMAQNAGYKVIVSHRSGESEDTTIADLAVGLNTGQIKTGAMCRSERVAKYNQLLRIEENIMHSMAGR